MENVWTEEEGRKEQEGLQNSTMKSFITDILRQILSIVMSRWTGRVDECLHCN